VDNATILARHLPELSFPQDAQVGEMGFRPNSAGRRIYTHGIATIVDMKSNEMKWT